MNKLAQVELLIDSQFVTGQFGDNWKEYAKENIDIDEIINIAWIQGRKAILLERVIKNLLPTECMGSVGLRSTTLSNYK